MSLIRFTGSLARQVCIERNGRPWREIGYVMRIELRWTLEHLRVRRSTVLCPKPRGELIAKVAALIAVPPAVYAQTTNESFGSILEDVELRGREAILDRGFNGKVRGDRFVLKPRDNPLHQWWVPCAKGVVSLEDIGSLISLRIRSIPITAILNLVGAILMCLVATVFGIALVSSGTTAGALAIAVGIGILAVYSYYIRRASTVGKVMTEVLVDQLYEIFGQPVVADPKV
jgi:hypothetical protein